MQGNPPGGGNVVAPVLAGGSVKQFLLRLIRESGEPEKTMELLAEHVGLPKEK